MCGKRYLRRLSVIVFASLCAALKSYGQEMTIPHELYVASSGIPDSLKEDANSIVRYSMDEVVIKGPGKLYIKHHSLVTILNEKGDKEALVQLFYNKKYDNYSAISIHLYDGDGLQI